ncbi:MAG: hypothetical protein JNK28_13195 [Burkholderiaceae bacterium]|nr:hypothetical protein [Burkholderiaceae bacterium]
MPDISSVDLAFGVLVVALAILVAALHEFRASNHRDAGALAVSGTLGLAGSLAVWLL